jgi:uncharacterized NAD-dependent epimerase/dehydratase family protein
MARPGGAAVKPSRAVILAEGLFDMEWAKTAACIIRYRPESVAAVLDSTRAGRDAAEVLGFGRGIPVLSDLSEALTLDPPPNALLLGIAPQGGGLAEEWRPAIGRAIRSGLDVWSGLHVFLGDDPELARLAAEHGVTLHDVRRPPTALPVATGRARETSALRVLTVGTDCNVGKMTVAMEVVGKLRERGLRAEFAATGQTGIMIEGRGIAVDAVVADFVAGAAECLVLDADPAADVIVVEGQGSLVHPGYSGVALSLMHGALPQVLILCTKPERKTIYGGNHDWVQVPPLDEVVRLHEDAMAWAWPEGRVRVAAVACNTYEKPEEEARREIRDAADLTGLPATDPIRCGPAKLVEAILAHLQRSTTDAAQDAGER